MDYEKVFDALIEKIGKEEISRIIVEKDCPHSYYLPDARDCKTDYQECPKCWTRALGMEEEIS
jgi:hypothetical protein